VATLRWGIAGMLTVAIAISYLDRQTLSVAIKAIQTDIPITNTQFAQLNSAFLLAYGLMYAGGGKLIDVLGTRRGFFYIMVFWSLACASHGFARSRKQVVRRFSWSSTGCDDTMACRADCHFTRWQEAGFRDQFDFSATGKGG